MTTPSVLTAYTARPGRPALQGAQLVDHTLEPCVANLATGTHFAVYAPAASQLLLCLFDINDTEHPLPMFPSPEGIWHVYVEGITTGQHYGFRADGDWAPTASPRFNRHKLLLDPYAREVRGQVIWNPALFDYTLVQEHERDQQHAVDNSPWQYNDHNSAPFMPRCVVRESRFNWQGINRPRTPDQHSVIYETHLKGFTQQHPAIPEHLRGTYLGLSHPATVAFLQQLGITAVELLPVTSMVSEERLSELGLSNYWGYNPLCLMAPEPKYAVHDPVTEMKTMVRELHRAGIEVIMDVVFNHTCEGGHGGPMLSFRGLADAEYYHMDHYQGSLSAVNYSGCGNTMNFDSHQTIKLTMDALRLWAEEYQIDGFRFDLAPTMARQNRHFHAGAPLLYAISQDPVLSQLKMIAEPWDIGPDGYHLTGFPKDWQVWNDRYRDGSRQFWQGQNNTVAEMAQRFAGSHDLFAHQSYRSTVNYICSHDGFTLMDLVSYNQRHNHANGEDNRDGDEHNHSWNHGCEGNTSASEIINARLQSRKNLLAMLLLARGTPMLLAGDDFSHSQQGNNNAYCQDSGLSWHDWHWLEHPETCDGGLLHRFTSQLVHYRRSQPLLTHEFNDTLYEFFTEQGERIEVQELAEQNQLIAKIRSRSNNPSGALIVIMNPSPEQIIVRLPTLSGLPRRWFVVLDTAIDHQLKKEPLLQNGWYATQPNSLVVIEDTH